MARPKKQTVDYFPHFVVDSMTKRVLKRYWHNDGYAFWFKMLEMLCSEDGHCLDLSTAAKWEDFLTFADVPEATAVAIFDKLAEIGKIDSELWQRKAVWCDSLIENLTSVYDKRKMIPPSKPLLECFLEPKNSKNEEFLSQKCEVSGVSVTETTGECTFGGVSVTETPQSIVKESRVEETIVEDKYILSSCHSTTCTQVIDYLNQLCGTNYNPSTKTTKQHINARIKEGYTFEDFKTVIDKKFYEWHNQPTMVQYLRPQTLFSTKFESYLNQPWVNPIKDNPTDIAIREFVRESQYIDQDDIIESTEGDDIF